jgi:sterol desaturase/sphingolipid hydroxylase (fatty acid hydroxylase superfamily)
MNFTFGAEKIDLSNLSTLGKSVPDLLIWAAPVMFLFVIIEYVVSRRLDHHNVYDKRETLGSILVGVGNVAIGVALKTLLFGLVVLAYNLVPWRMEFSWWSFIPCYIIFDLCSYWAHNVSHRMRFLWATHVAHHSGEHYNLTVSFRLSWVQWLKIVFFLPVAFLGFHPVIIFFVNQIAILFQFWQHTEYIGKLHPWLEYIIATVHRRNISTRITVLLSSSGIVFSERTRKRMSPPSTVLRKTSNTLTSMILFISIFTNTSICLRMSGERAIGKKASSTFSETPKTSTSTSFKTVSFRPLLTKNIRPTW